MTETTFLLAQLFPVHLDTLEEVRVKYHLIEDQAD
jgi:hypothetical protein